MEIGKFYIFGKAVWGCLGVAGEFFPEFGNFIFCGIFVSFTSGRPLTREKLPEIRNFYFLGIFVSFTRVAVGTFFPEIGIFIFWEFLLVLRGWQARGSLAERRA